MFIGPSVIKTLLWQCYGGKQWQFFSLPPNECGGDAGFHMAAHGSHYFHNEWRVQNGYGEKGGTS